MIIHQDPARINITFLTIIPKKDGPRLFHPLCFHLRIYQEFAVIFSPNVHVNLFDFL